MNLHQWLYSLSHNPTVGIMPFVNEVLTVVCQLESIKHKPQKDEIIDKLLIGLHSSFAALCTNLSLRTPEPSIKEITATLKELKDNETLQHSFSALIDSSIKEETLLYANKAHHHPSGGNGSRTRYDDFDWGNTKMVSVFAMGILVMLHRTVWLICQQRSRNVSSTITPTMHTLQLKMHSALPSHRFQLTTRSSLHCLKTTMHILQLILQTGAYLDLTKMFPSSFKLLMDMSVMIIRHYFPLLSLQLLFYYFGGVVSQGVFWSLSRAPIM